MTSREKLERLMSENRVSGEDRASLRDFADFLATRAAYRAAVAAYGKESPEALALRDALVAGME